MLTYFLFFCRAFWHRTYYWPSAFLPYYLFLQFCDPPHEFLRSFFHVLAFVTLRRRIDHWWSGGCGVKPWSYRTCSLCALLFRAHRPCPTKGCTCRLLGAILVSSTNTPSLCCSSILSPLLMLYMKLPSGWSGALNTTVWPGLQIADAEGFLDIT